MGNVMMLIYLTILTTVMWFAVSQTQDDIKRLRHNVQSLIANIECRQESSE